MAAISLDPWHVHRQRDTRASNILVVDDEDVVRDVVVRYLEHEGMRTVQAADGEEARRIDRD